MIDGLSFYFIIVIINSCYKHKKTGKAKAYNSIYYRNLLSRRHCITQDVSGLQWANSNERRFKGVGYSLFTIKFFVSAQHMTHGT